MNTKSEVLRLRISPELKEKIQAASDAENRTMSNWLTTIIKQNLEDKMTIIKAEQINANEVYYEEIFEKGNSHIVLYDEDLNTTRKVEVKYMDAIAGLKRVVHESRVDMVLREMYSLVPLQNGFCEVIKNEQTSEMLRAAAENLATRNC